MSDTIEINTSPATPYRVLARKYRPQTFEDLIGQDAMVRTLTNAFASGRIAQAYMLTGVRGIGKTTTARLIARALNFEGEGEDTGPSVDLAIKGRHCEAILESRHVDVIEMDAASHTGVDNVREINDAVKYKPASARYKVYIIDEVHMLSTQAFNALLKTLEEPPPHVKFIFATTEIRKVPITVLSRCQRFDLRRLDADLLVSHFARIAGLEKVDVEEDALRMIARAAEGSVRDGLSLLDQAIAYGDDKVHATDVQSMLGLSDRARVIDLFEMLMRGDAAAALVEFESQHNMGADPQVVLADLAEFVNLVTKLRVSPKIADKLALSQQEKTKGLEFAEKLTMPVLARTWQMLLKGLDEVSSAANAFMAAEMVLIRLSHVVDMPTPEQLATIVKGSQKADTTQTAAASAAESGRRNDAHDTGGGNTAGAALQPASKPPLPPVTHSPVMTAVQRKPSEDNVAPVESLTAPPSTFASFDDLVKYVDAKRDVKLARELKHHVLPVSLGPGHIEVSLLPSAPNGIANELMRRLEAWTGKRWIVSVTSSKVTGQTLAEQKREQDNNLLHSARQNEDVRAVLDAFPGAEIVEVRQLSGVNDTPGEQDMSEDDDTDPFSD